MVWICFFSTASYPEDLKCHVCNGTDSAQCDDPFGHIAENGELVHPTNFLVKCNDPQIKRNFGIPEDKMAIMCRKMTHNGKNYVW